MRRSAASAGLTGNATTAGGDGGGSVPSSRGGVGRHGSSTASAAPTATARGGGPAPDTDPATRPLVVVAESSTLAFAVYDELTNAVLLEECRAHGGADTERAISGFVQLTQPNLVVVGGKVAGNSGLMRLLTQGGVGSDDDARPTSEGDGDGDGEGPTEDGGGGPTASIPYKLLKSAAFDLRNCRSLILTKLRVLTLLRQEQQNGGGVGGGGGMNMQQQQQQQQQQQGYFPRSVTSHHDGSLHTTSSSNNSNSYHSLSSLLDLSSSSRSSPLVRALGALLHHLQCTTHALEDGGTVTVHSVRHAHSSQYMRIDAATLDSLHIFATDHHPLLAAKGGSGKGRGGRGGGGGGGGMKDKEGFSLYTVLDRTRSKMGPSKMREMMVQPLLDVEAIRRRYDGIDLFLRAECQSSVGTVLALLGRVGAIDKILLRMQRVNAVPMDFLTLSQTLGCAVGICTTLAGEVREVLRRAHQRELEERQMEGREEDGSTTSSTTTALRQLAFLDDILRRCHVPTLRELHERITTIVDHELTAERKDSVEVHYGFHEELDSAKEAFDTLDETLSAVGSEVLAKHPELQRLTVVFLPQVGFLIQLDRRNHAHDVATNTFPDLPADFTFVFLQAQDDAVYFKNADMRQLDEEVGDLDAYIKDTQLMIVHELEDDILDREAELRGTFGAIADLDCILSFTACASDLNFVRPEIVAPPPGSDECSIYVENGRHPLQELVIDDEFIANNVMIDSTNRVNVVTGPNFSGKSCYARQVGVLVYMAHIGCFIPCDRARITITDQILARISSVETCAVPQSSFQQDLTQMATILRRSTPRTLVLIDEFGKGTSPSSGIAVLTSALKKLSSIKCKVVCTTHFLEVFSLGLLKDGQDGIKTLQMAVHIPSSDQDNPVPLFKLEEGVANSSAGLVCAKMAGVKRSVVGRANEILGALKDGKAVRPIAIMNNNNHVLQPESKAALRMFLGNNSWLNATNEQVDTLQDMIVRM